MEEITDKKMSYKMALMEYINVIDVLLICEREKMYQELNHEEDNLERIFVGHLEKYFLKEKYSFS